MLETRLPTSFNADLLMRDGRLGIWRSIDGRPPYLDGNAIFLIETLKYTSRYTWLRAYHATTLLGRRIIAYNSTTGYTERGPYAADLMLTQFVSENMGSGIVGGFRDGVETQADISAYVTIPASLSLGASVAKAAARRNLLDVARELCEASTTAGTYLTFEIIAPTEDTLELRIYATVRGVDRRSNTANPVILSEARGNLESAELLIDYHDEATFTIAGGTGEGTSRLIATQLDTARMGVSPFGRIERFLDMANVSNTTALQDDADAGVRAGRPLILFTGDLVETPALTRGIHFDLGDMVTAEHPRTRQQFDVRLDVIRETITPGKRTVQCGLRSVI